MKVPICRECGERWANGGDGFCRRCDPYQARASIDGTSLPPLKRGPRGRIERNGAGKLEAPRYGEGMSPEEADRLAQAIRFRWVVQPRIDDERAIVTGPRQPLRTVTVGAREYDVVWDGSRGAL